MRCKTMCIYTLITSDLTKIINSRMNALGSGLSSEKNTTRSGILVLLMRNIVKKEAKLRVVTGR